MPKPDASVGRREATGGREIHNIAQWRPTKYVWHHGRLRASRDAAHIGVGSRLIGDAVAACYQQHLPRRAHGRLADLGCGRVPLYALYGPLVGAAITDVTCVDWAESLHANPHLDQLADLNRPLPFADAAFDTLVLSDVLEHIAEPQALWSELARLLAPGGALLLNVPFLYGIHEAPHDYARYTGYALRRAAESQGLVVAHLQAVGGSLSVFADLTAKHLQAVPALGGALAAGLQAVAGALIGSGFGRRVETRSALHFPLGYFMVATRPA